MPATKIEDLPTVYNAKETEESIYKFSDFSKRMQKVLKNLIR